MKVGNQDKQVRNRKDVRNVRVNDRNLLKGMSGNE